MMGRDYNDGFSVWLSEDTGKTWVRADVSYHHNAKANVSKARVVPAAVNTSKGPPTAFSGTSGYAGLVRVGEMSAAILYDWDFWTDGPHNQLPGSVRPGAMRRSAVTEQPGSSEFDDIHELHPPYVSLPFAMRIDLVSAKQDRHSSDSVV